MIVILILIFGFLMIRKLGTKIMRNQEKLYETLENTRDSLKKDPSFKEE